MDLERVEACLAPIVRADSDQVEVYLALATVYRRRGEVGRAIRVHQNLLLRSDLSRELRDRALRGLARDFQAGGFLRRATAAFEELRDRHPRDPEVLSSLARLYAEGREPARALALTRRLGRVQGRDVRREEARLRVEVARAAQAEGRSEVARRALRRALRRDPACAEAWIELGALEAERGRGKRALAAWKKVAELDPRAAARVYPRLEATYASLGRSREFESWLRELLSRRPGDAAARLALVRTLAGRGAVEAALEEADPLLAEGSPNLPAHAARARVLLGAGREAEASKALEEILVVLDGLGLLEPGESLD